MRNTLKFVVFKLFQRENFLEKLDLRRIPCPKNTSKALIFLSTIDSGEKIEIWLDDGEPIDNVPESLILEGHHVVSKNKDPEGHWVLIVKAS